MTLQRCFVVLLVLQACRRDADSHAPAESPAVHPPPRVTRRFAGSVEDFLNPERGVYAWIDLVQGTDFSAVRGKGSTLAFAAVSLAAYREAPLDEALLGLLRRGFDAARAAKIKVILRFRYNSRIGDPDASKDRILGHIDQLKPLLQEHADVIAVLQAGFIGAWGEWHHSTHGLDNPADRQDILSALLSALPAHRLVQVRTPHFKDQTVGGPLDPEEALSGSPRARVGHHNDAFLAGTDDWGTYLDPVETWKRWLETDSRFVPVGGETAQLNPPRTDPSLALAEMERFHWSFLNGSYHPDVIQSWKDKGAWTELRRRLGYRLSLTDAEWPEGVAPGGRFELSLSLRNEGFAAPWNFRAVRIVLSQGGTRWQARLDADPRRWHGGSPVQLFAALRAPASLAPGRYRLALWLPDEAPALREDPAYAIRLANEGIWNAAEGVNVLTEDFWVDPGAAEVPGGPAGSFEKL